jgi:hypothetical protein
VIDRENAFGTRRVPEIKLAESEAITVGDRSNGRPNTFYMAQQCLSIEIVGLEGVVANVTVRF